MADLATVAPLPLPAALRRTSVCTNTSKVLPGASQNSCAEAALEVQIYVCLCSQKLKFTYLVFTLSSNFTFYTLPKVTQGNSIAQFKRRYEVKKKLWTPLQIVPFYI